MPPISRPQMPSGGAPGRQFNSVCLLFDSRSALRLYPSRPQVVRQRQQVQTAADRASGAGYSGSLQAAATIARVEGPLALYRGFGVTQLVWAPFNAVFLPLWEGTKRLGVSVTGAPSVRCPQALAWGQQSCTGWWIETEALAGCFCLRPPLQVQGLPIEWELGAAFFSSAFAGALPASLGRLLGCGL